MKGLQELVDAWFVERVGNACRITDKVNIHDLQDKLRRRIDMITQTAQKVSEAHADA